MRFDAPYWFLALLLAWWPLWRVRARPGLPWPTLRGFAKAPRGLSWLGRILLPTIRTATLVGVVAALARPQTVAGTTRVQGRGVTIVVALDRSGSMRSEPLGDGPDAPGRLAAALRTFEGFVRGRPDDQIGLVTFGNLPETACPPTLDHDFLLATASGVLEPDPTLEDGTNLGDAIAWAVADAKAVRAERRVVVLMTDGRHRPAIGPVVRDPIAPEAAATLASRLGVRLHTIAIGVPSPSVGHSEGEDRAAEIPTDGPNVELLRRLASLGGGEPFEAAEPGDLEAVFRALDRLEPGTLRGLIRTRYQEWYGLVAAIALGLLPADLWLAAGRLRRVP